MTETQNIKYLGNYTINMKAILGKGSTGTVYEGYNVKNNKIVAIKRIDLETVNNEVASYLLKMEKIALMQVESRYLLKGIKIIESERYHYLVTEFCDGGTLKNMILNSPGCRIPEEKALKIFYCLLLGCRDMFKKGILHRDLKTTNIMFDKGLPKIIDFGYSEVKGYPKPSTSYNVGSPSYMAPEIYNHAPSSPSSEVWSLGIILYEMLTGSALDKGRDLREVYTEVAQGLIHYPTWVGTVPREIIGMCLQINPSKRPTLEYLINTFFLERSQEKEKIRNFTQGEQTKEKKENNDRKEKEKEREKYLRRKEETEILERRYQTENVLDRKENERHSKKLDVRKIKEALENSIKKRNLKMENSEPDHQEFAKDNREDIFKNFDFDLKINQTTTQHFRKASNFDHRTQPQPPSRPLLTSRPGPSQSSPITPQIVHQKVPQNFLQNFNEKYENMDIFTEKNIPKFKENLTNPEKPSKNTKNSNNFTHFDEKTNVNNYKGNYETFSNNFKEIYNTNQKYIEKTKEKTMEKMFIEKSMEKYIEKEKGSFATADTDKNENRDKEFYRIFGGEGWGGNGRTLSSKRIKGMTAKQQFYQMAFEMENDLRSKIKSKADYFRA